MSRLIMLATVGVLLLGLGGPIVAQAQNASGVADPRVDFAAGSNAMNGAWRRDQIARQLDLNYRMQWMAGFGPQLAGPFEPWPRVPGDIWGYPQARPIVHPSGHESAQVSPTRWIYRPIYGPSVWVQPAPPPALPANNTGDGNVQRPAPSDVIAPQQRLPANRREF
jgi:hypothetical protein